MFRSLCMHVNVWMCMRGRFYFLMAKPFSVFYSKTGFWPSYHQISADLDKIWHTPNVVQNTFVGQLRPRSAPGRLQAKSKRLFFVILVTANSQSGCEDGCYCEKFRNFVTWAEPDQKSLNYPAHSLQETVLPQTNGTDGKPRLWRRAFC